MAVAISAARERHSSYFSHLDKYRFHRNESIVAGEEHTRLIRQATVVAIFTWWLIKTRAPWSHVCDSSDGVTCRDVCFWWQDDRLTFRSVYAERSLSSRGVIACGRI